MAEDDAPQDFVNTDDKQEETSEKIQELVFPSLEAENIESKTRTTQNPNITAEEDDNRVPHVYCPSMGDIKPVPTPFTEDLIKDVDVILVTATEVEFRAVIGQANDANSFLQISHNNVTFYLGFYGLCKVAVILTGQTGRKTREYLDEVRKVIKARYVIAVGICYGMNENKVKPGDVIVAESIFDTSNKRAQKEETISRPEEYKCGEYLYNMFKQSAGFDLKNGSGSVSIKFGPLASEPTLVANQEYKNIISRHIPQALGGEMEGNGIMESAKAGNFQGIVIKAVADYGNEDKEPYRKWQEFAATAAASYVLFHLQQRDNNLQLQTNIARTSEVEIASILERHYSLLSQSMTSPYTVVRICQILYSKRCVDESVLDKVELANASLEDKRRALMGAIEKAVSDDHRKLHELATVLDQFKETKSVANNVINDYNLKIVKKAASEAMRMNIVDLKITISATSATFEDIILACKKKNLISSNVKTKLLDSSTNKTTRCSNLITHIHDLVGVQPAHLDTFLCILNGKDSIASEVANSVAKSYGYNLPKYERIRGVGGATSVISSDDNVEEMVPQYDQMSNEDRASDILRTHYSTLSQSLKDPVNIARLLHEEDILANDEYSIFHSTSTCRCAVLLRSIRRAIRDNHQHLKEFGRVLQQLTAGNERVGQDILNDYNKVFPPTSIFPMTSTSSTTTVQSSTGAEASDVLPLTRDMEEEFTLIRGKFGEILLHIKRIIEKRNIPLGDVRSFCKFTYPKEISDYQTMEDVLTFIANKCTLINISLLRKLVDVFEIADEAKQHIQAYQKAIDDFSQKMRVRFPLNQSLLPDGTPHPLRGETITFVMKWNPESVSLNDIEDLQTYAFGSLFENVNVIKMEPINSIMITCSFPFELTGLLMAEAMNNLKLLKKNGLLKLTIGYCTIWNLHEETDKLTEVIINEETVGDTSDITERDPVVKLHDPNMAAWGELAAEEDAPQVLEYTTAVPEESFEQKQQLVIPSLEAENIGSTTRHTHNDTDKQNVNITPTKFQEILTSKNKWEAPVKPVLLMTGGLPHSGQSEAIRQLLHLSSAESVKKAGFTHHDVISVGDRLVTTKDPYLSHHFGFLAGIRTNFNDETTQVDHFTDDDLSASLADECIPHYLSLRESWKNLKEKSTIKGLFHSSSLKRGPALVKIWDVAFDSFSSQFLRCFSGHFYNSYMWLFTHIERDLRKLHVPPSRDITTQPVRRSRIQYFLNPSKLSSKLNGKRESAVCAIFATNEGGVNLERKISELQRECNSAAPQLKCSKLINDEIIPICFNNESGSKFVSRRLRQELKKAVSKAPQGIPLSHLFLRGSLELESSVFMRREELKRKARLCGIDDDESFDEFCKSFTSFGSIIDVGLVSTSDIIIVKPDEFLTTLDQAFNFEKIKDKKLAYNGILTSDVALSLLGKEYQLFLEVLEAVGLATPVAGGQCQPPQDSSQCYYMPSLRQHGEVKEFNPDAIQMIRSHRYPSINMEVALTKHLLQSLPEARLVLTGKKNSTIITLSAGDVTITYHGEAIEFLVSPDHKDVIRQVIEACKEISLSLSNRSGEAKFHFTVLCKKHTNYLAAYSYYRKRHVLENVTEDCKQCNLTETVNMMTWSTLINEAKIDDEKFKLNGSLTIPDTSRLIDEISTYDAFNVQLFIRALNSSKELPEDRSKWKWTLMEVFVLWINQVHKESTKKEMAIMLIEVDEKCNKKEAEKKPKFKKLARELDLQTLTKAQIQELDRQE